MTYDASLTTDEGKNGCQISIAAETDHPSSPPNCHGAPAPTVATSGNGKSRGGAPLGNVNRLTTGRKSTTHPPRGSKPHRDYFYAGNKADQRVKAIAAELTANCGGGTLTSAQEVILRQIWLAEFRDRRAGMLLGNGKNFKNKPLTIEGQNEQLEIQRRSQQEIETCLEKLGLGLDIQALANDPAAAFLNFDATRKDQGIRGRFSAARNQPAATQDTATANKVPPSFSDEPSDPLPDPSEPDLA
ncbi:MAG: hypothetical protein L0211_06605 [Planctomycetaceae bacterium]|nr:hypothetical protein [Planctomycetaceae bacterium]